MTITADPASEFTAEQHPELDRETLDHFRELAAADDAGNRFFAETHAELVAMGHYTANMPTGIGGGGLNLVEMGRRQRLLGRHAPAPGLASCMHLYWTGAATDLQKMGLDSLAFVLDDAATGEIFASGHAESGNDVAVAASTVDAVPVDGGYRITGAKHFGSLGPVWDQIGFHAQDSSDPDNPVVIHGFARRSDPGVGVRENWDTIAMRASQSYDTVFESVFVPHERVAAVEPVGSEASPVLGAFFTWALTLISNVYLGLGERALELATDAATQRTSIGLEGRTLAHNPMLQHQVAEATMALDSVRSQLELLAGDWVAGEVGDDWAVRLYSAKHCTSVQVRRAVDLSAEILGGSSISNRGEFARLWRDSRGIAFHPPSDALAHEQVAKAVLGIDPTGPRW